LRSLGFYNAPRGSRKKEEGHALVVTVRIAPGQYDAAQKALQTQVIPRVSQAPGFVQGYWTVNQARDQGTSMVVFRTAQDAQNAAATVRSNPVPQGVTIVSAEVYEVNGEAKAAAGV